MKRLFAAALLAAACLASGCGTDETSRDDLAPSAPVLIARSNDNEPPQQGVRASPVPTSEAALEYAVVLEWWANPEEDVAGYRVFRAAEFDPVHRYVIDDLALDVDLPRGRDRYSYVDKGDSTGGTVHGLLAPDGEGVSRGYLWSVVAYDDANNRSDFSQPVYYRLIRNPEQVAVTRGAGAEQYVLSWRDPNFSDIEERASYWVIRVYPRFRGPGELAKFEIARRYEANPSWQLDFSTPIQPMLRDCTYICQLNGISDLRTPSHVDSIAGSAVYTTFIYQN